MNSRRIKITAAVLAIASTALLIGVLIAALNTDNKKPRKLASVDVSELKPGHVLISDTDALRYYVIRPHTGDIYVIAAPLDDNTVPMPESYWWKPIMRCIDFGLSGSGGEITEGTRFHCRDPGQPDEWVQRWQWDIQGRHIPNTTNTPVDDLYRVRIEHDDDEIVFLGLDN